MHSGTSRSPSLDVCLRLRKVTRALVALPPKSHLCIDIYTHGGHSLGKPILRRRLKQLPALEALHRDNHSETGVH